MAPVGASTWLKFQGWIWYNIDGIPVRLISLEDLIANKKASGRAKDLADVEILEGCRK